MSIEEQKTPKKGPLGRLFKWINGLRLFILNLLFIGFVVLLVVSFIPVKDKTGENSSVLLVNPTGRLVIRSSMSPFLTSLEAMDGTAPSETQLLDLLSVLDLALDDPDISAIELDLSGLSPSGLAMVKPFRDKLMEFRKRNKDIYVYADYMSEEHFYLYTTASELWIDPMFFLEPLGFSSSRLYLGDALEEWGINTHIYKTGLHKSYTEVFSESSLSDESRTELKRWMDRLWELYLTDISENLGIKSFYLSNWITNIPANLSKNNGDWVQVLKDEGWITGEADRDTFQQILRDSKHNWKGTGESLPFLIYGQKKLNFSLNGNVALLPLTGEIRYGEGDWGYIGSESTKRSLELIKDNPQIEGLILWLDTPGGSVRGSEEIRRLVEKISEQIPVIVLSAGVNASGGYWITSAADYHLGQSATITGSIGVFSYYFSLEDLLKERFSIGEDGYQTTDIAQGYSLTSSPSEGFSTIQQSEVNFIYNYFLKLVSKGRDIPMEKLAPLAEGRVWTGDEAVENNLMDNIGGIEEALHWLEDSQGLKRTEITIYQEDYRYSNSAINPFRVLMGKIVGDQVKELLYEIISQEKIYQYQ